jgi:hypothetical protein
MNRYESSFVPKLTNLEQREGPATITTNSVLLTNAPPSNDSVPDLIHIVSSKVDARHSQNTVAAVITAGHKSKGTDQQNTVGEASEDLEVVSAGIVIPSSSDKASISSVSLPALTHGHNYPPPHRLPPVRVPVS